MVEGDGKASKRERGDGEFTKVELDGSSELVQRRSAEVDRAESRLERLASCHEQA